MKNLSVTQEKPDTKATDERKAALLAEISSLGKDRELLDEAVKKHAAKKLKVTALDQEILDREIRVKQLEEQEKLVIRRNNILGAENNRLRVLVDENADIEEKTVKGKKVLDTINAEIANRQKLGTELDAKYISNLEALKEQVVTIKKGADKIIENLK